MTVIQIREIRTLVEHKFTKNQKKFEIIHKSLGLFQKVLGGFMLRREAVPCRGPYFSSG